MVAALVALLILNPGADVIDRIMAVVGTQPITLSEVAAAIQFDLVTVPPATKDPTGYALDRLIDRTLMLVEVDRFQPPEPDPSEITVRIDRLQARFGSAGALDTALAVTGMTREQLRRFVRDSLRMQTYVNQRFGTILDPVEHQESIAAWVRELRRRAQVTVLYRPAPPKL
jgi:hypothetical protein